MTKHVEIIAKTHHDLRRGLLGAVLNSINHSNDDEAKIWHSQAYTSWHELTDDRKSLYLWSAERLIKALEYNGYKIKKQWWRL